MERFLNFTTCNKGDQHILRTRTGHVQVVSMDVKIAGFLRKAYNLTYAIIIRIGNCATGCVCTIDRIQLYQ